MTEADLARIRNETTAKGMSRGLTREEAEDAASEAVLELLKLGGCPSLLYVRGVTRNVVSDSLRKAVEGRMFRIPFSEDGIPFSEDSSEVGREDDIIDAIVAKDTFEALPEVHQTTIASLARNVTSASRYGYKEVGKELGVAMPRNKILRARRHAAALGEDTCPKMSSLTVETIAPWKDAEGVEHEWLPNGGPFVKNRTGILLHATGGGTTSGAIETLKERKLSYHYIIAKDGHVTKCCPTSNKAWHAGESVGWDGSGVNSYGIGISLVNEDDGLHPYPTEQVEAARLLVAQLKAAIPTIKKISTHAIVSPGRKIDPYKFDIDTFAKSVGLTLWRPRAKA